jgi:hypothetical protein
MKADLLADSYFDVTSPEKFGKDKINILYKTSYATTTVMCLQIPTIFSIQDFFSVSY